MKSDDKPIRHDDSPVPPEDDAEARKNREELDKRVAADRERAVAERAALEEAGSARTRAQAEKPVSRSRAADIDEIVDGWVADHVRGSPIGRSTDAYNHLMGEALTELKRRLKGE